MSAKGDSAEPSEVARLVAERLSTYLGPHTARVAVKTFTAKALGRGPETLSRADVPALVEALKPMLRPFLGRERSEAVLDAMKKELAR